MTFFVILLCFIDPGISRQGVRFLKRGRGRARVLTHVPLMLLPIFEIKLILHRWTASAVLRGCSSQWKSRANIA